MFALPTFAVVPALSGFGSVILPIVAGDFLAWVLTAALMVSLIGILRVRGSADYQHSTATPKLPKRETLITIDLPHKAAA